MFQGGQNFANAMMQLAEGLGQRADRTKALRQVVKSYAPEGPAGDAMKAWADSAGLGELEGKIQGITLQQAQARQQAQMKDWRAQAKEREQLGQWRHQQMEGMKAEQTGLARFRDAAGSALTPAGTFFNQLAPPELRVQAPELTAQDLVRLGIQTGAPSGEVLNYANALKAGLLQGKETFFQPTDKVQELPGEVGENWSRVVLGPNTSQLVFKGAGRPVAQHDEGNNLLGFSFTDARGHSVFRPMTGPKMKQALDETTGEPIEGFYVDASGKVHDVRSVIQKTVGTEPGSKPAAGRSGKKVMVEKDGKKYYLPEEQIEEARKQGYRQVK